MMKYDAVYKNLLLGGRKVDIGVRDGKIAYIGDIAEDGKDFGGLICVGVGAIIVVQTIENLGMCLAMLPVVGITLPFLSCGGSSVLATYVLLSLVHSVSSHRSKMRENSFNDIKRR